MLKQILIFIIIIFSIIGCNQKSDTINFKNIENRMALKELVDTFSILADKKETDAQTFLFTEDAEVYTYNEGELTTILKGRDEIGKAFGDYLSLFETVYHINGQQTVNIDGDKADGISYCQVVLVRIENGKKIALIRGVYYNDEYTNIDGKWLISKRTSNFVWSDSRIIE
ncbi:nuclear transport factor 2 family protein [Brachyspira catarrhinii]|uniref:Nuclear transport factor 2 family protein n=1 Tax=Brachyspira catarrhinii TaxID=2528966 RepID=A0ABY2TNP5_9SPIR|nr:nuclear transport factor 2 family protein [Brachyspira catarrhinii]TKZ30353.1 nuclear transport factor 2 family protein [Brachyspira catarrhinii]